MTLASAVALAITLGVGVAVGATVAAAVPVLAGVTVTVDVPEVALTVGVEVAVADSVPTLVGEAVRVVTGVLVPGVLAMVKTELPPDVDVLDVDVLVLTRVAVAVVPAVGGTALGVVVAVEAGLDVPTGVVFAVGNGVPNSWACAGAGAIQRQSSSRMPPSPLDGALC